MTAASNTPCLTTHLTSAAAAAALTALMFVAVAFPPARPAQEAAVTTAPESPSLELIA